MLNKLRSNQGFTLIELLIVVAIIGILAAIAIPQFSAYRIKGFNTAAVSDLKNGKTAEESLFADNQTYGWSEASLGTIGVALGTGGGGGLITGPVGPAPTVAGVNGAALAGKRGDGSVAAIGVAASNGVIWFANTTAANNTPAYVLGSKHTQGSRVYASESATTGVLFVQNDGTTFVGVALSANTGTPATGIPAAASVAPTIVAGTTAGGGSPTATWSIM